MTNNNTQYQLLYSYSNHWNYKKKSVPPALSALVMELRKIVVNHSNEYWYIGSIFDRSDTQKNSIWVFTATGKYKLLIVSISFSVCSAIATFAWKKSNSNTILHSSFNSMFINSNIYSTHHSTAGFELQIKLMIWD